MSLTTLWIVWAVIGLAGGYMGSRLVMGGRRLLLSMVVALAGSLLGGWLFVSYMGYTEQNGYLSLLTSMILCAVFTWCCVTVCGRRSGGEN